MNIRQLCSSLLGGAVLCLAACGGGGGGGVQSTPFVSTPTPTPTPTPSPSPTCPPDCEVTIFAQPEVGAYVSVGASVDGPGGNLDTYPQPQLFGDVSSAASDQPQIRYTSAGDYEIKMPGTDWDRLVTYKGFMPADADAAALNPYFQPASVPQNYGFLYINQSRLVGYRYSELARWGSSAAGKFGVVAFGMPTAADQVPVAGTASFDGVVLGSADVMETDNLLGGSAPVAVSGTVNLNFDFGQGSLAGAMTVQLVGFEGEAPLGTYAFKDTIFSVGSATYSGAFDTTAAGQNFFLGRFTGPNAEETIGGWALPFLFSTGTGSLPADNQLHQAFGAWVAKKGP